MQLLFIFIVIFNICCCCYCCCYDFIGLLPYNLLCVQTGLVLAELQSLPVLDWRSVISVLLAMVALLASALLLKLCRRLSLNNNYSSSRGAH